MKNAKEINEDDAFSIPNSLTEAFRAQVQRSPHACALVDERRRLSYEELDWLSDAIARSFPEHNGFIGLVMDHSVEMIASLWAILKVGAAYVPIDLFFHVCAFTTSLIKVSVRSL